MRTITFNETSLAVIILRKGKVSEYILSLVRMVDWL